MDSAQREELEKKRIHTVRNLNILDSKKEERFDRITRISTKLFSVPVSAISIVDENRIWFKSEVGLDIAEVERKGSFEDIIVNKSKELVLHNASEDEVFKNNVLVRSGPKINFYAGFPLKSDNGEIVGVFSLADRIPKRFSDYELSVFKDVAMWAQMEMRQGDITYEKAKLELLNKNRELVEEKARQDAMIQNIGDGVIGINDKGMIIFINNQAEEMTGFKKEELVGKPLMHTIKLVDEKKKEVAITSRPIRNALYLKKRIQSNSYFYVRKDGSVFPAAITATPVVIVNQVVGGVNVFRDITKEYEIDRMKTEFISLASHQLRTPLSAMKWFSEMIIDEDAGQLNKEQKELMGNIYQSNERMIQLVNTLLNISRIESGRIIIEPKPTDLIKLVNEVIIELKPKIEDKKHKLVVSTHQKLPQINIDSKLVRHVYMNLLTNAIKYTPEGGEVVVMISKSGNEVISQVSDTGYGIPKDQHEKVFSKFFRASNIAKRETDGTGLGLYLTKAIVDSSGGKIWFESEEGKGTTFWFILPLFGSQKKEGEVSLDS
jgi:PAS domain S-box-containing protein